MLRYKAEEAGAELVEVPTRSLKPTQRCARCWETTTKSLSQRIHHCAHCGFTLDRDWNAALVALIYAMSGNGREPAAGVRLPPSGARWHETRSPGEVPSSSTPGRLHRQHHAKTEVRIVDYVDRDVPLLARMFDKRMRGYRAMGCVLGEHRASHGMEDDAYVIEYDEEVLRSLDNNFP